SLFISMLRRPPSPPLFPYTTLFRSYQDLLERPPFRDDDTGLWIVARDRDVRIVLRDTIDYSNRLTLFPHYPLCAEAMAVLGQMADRKSTRLNSSHVKISYAVFCLKK